ncbi:MAG TPA: hypothetical protein VJP08_01545, partial [Actinomycetota bacterium]|nr:hypothetical protein [Actinomycetota bacterium]
MANQAHTHGSAPPHEHDDATPGHSHDPQGNVVASTTTGSHGFDTPAAGTAAPAAGTAATTMAAAHSHPDTGEHTHADDAAGHTHEAAPVGREGVEVGPSGSSMAARLIFTLLGAAGMIVGAFLPWFSFDATEAPPGIGLDGIESKYSVFYSTDNPFGASFFESAGLIAIVLGVLALLGLVFRTGWLTTLAGVLGIVA